MICDAFLTLKADNKCVVSNHIRGILYLQDKPLKKTIQRLARLSSNLLVGNIHFYEISQLPLFFSFFRSTLRSRDSAEVLCRRRLEIHRFHSSSPGVRKSPSTYLKNQRNQQKLVTPQA